MTVKLVRVPRWPYIALIDCSPHSEAARCAVERFERAERRLNGRRTDALDRIERQASKIVRVADDMLEEGEADDEPRRRGSKRKG